MPFIPSAIANIGRSARASASRRQDEVVGEVEV
jgi:hypothetical protein